MHIKHYSAAKCKLVPVPAVKS